MSNEWKDAIPEELKSDPLWERFEGKDLADVLKSTVHAHHQAVGSTKIPSAESSEEELEKFYSKLRPETDEQYDMTLSEEIEWNTDSLTAFKKVAHKHGLSSKQLQGVLNDGWVPMVKGAVEEQTKGWQEMERTAKQELGDRYQSHLNNTERFFQQMDQPGVFEELKNTSLIHNPKALAVFSQAFDLFDEDTLVESGPVKFPHPNDVKKEIVKRREDPNDPVNQISHPQHDEAVKELNALYAKKAALT
jgi:hypothetical protein